jgi:Icc-related predicted phosphoesterase
MPSKRTILVSFCNVEEAVFWTAIGNSRQWKGLLLHCLFATDLHGHTDRYDKLFASIVREHPTAVFLGGDLLPRSPLAAVPSKQTDFVRDYLAPGFVSVREATGIEYPDIFLILGNDDPRSEEESFVAGERGGIWHYVQGKKFIWRAYSICGLAYVPPTPFSLKDWERYDISRYVPPGCISPQEGRRSVPVEESQIKWGSVQKERAAISGEGPLDRAVFLLHTPPYDTPLDRAALDGKTYEHVPLDVHVRTSRSHSLSRNDNPCSPCTATCTSRHV